MLTGHSFFPSLISKPFSKGLDTAFGFAIVACLIAAVASLARGGRYTHTEPSEAKPARGPRTDTRTRGVTCELIGTGSRRSRSTARRRRSSSTRGATCRRPRPTASTWDYPAIASPDATDLLIVTHEHLDHNAVEVITGEPTLVRSQAGTHESPIGNVVAIASEHDDVAGTERGPNTIVVFDLDGIRVAHFGDFGQAALRPEQRAHLDGIDLLFLPVGGGFTIGGAQAAEIAKDLAPSWVVPMHYKTPKISFLETEAEFVDAMPKAERLDVTVLRDRRPGEGRTPRW